MADQLPAISDEPLHALIDRSPLLADASLRRHWSRLVPWLSPPVRYQLAALLLEVEQALD